MAAHIVLPWTHRVFSNLKTWALGVYHGLRREHFQSYLDEFVFRFNRRRSRSRGLVFYRALELAAAHEPVRYRELIASPKPGAIRRPPPGTRGRPPSLERHRAGRPWRRPTQLHSA